MTVFASKCETCGQACKGYVGWNMHGGPFCEKCIPSSFTREESEAMRRNLISHMAKGSKLLRTS